MFSARDPSAELAGLPELEVAGLDDSNARALLEAALAGPLDARVRDQFIAETRGNPLALLELPRGLTAAQLAGGFGLPGALVWYWQQAQSPGERAISVLKALVWPAFLVYDALKALHR